MNATHAKALALGIEGVLGAAGLVRILGPDEVYAEGDTAVFRKKSRETPDRALTITVYDIEPTSPQFEPHTVGTAYMVQIRARAGVQDEFGVDDLAGDVVNLLHGVHHALWGEVKVERCTYLSGGSIGADSIDRFEWSVNFRVITQ